MIRSNISNIKENKTKLSEFPVLMRANDFNYVVLFSGHSEGVVVWSETERYPVGYHSKFWINYNNHFWIKFEGKVTLENVV